MSKMRSASKLFHRQASDAGWKPIGFACFLLLLSFLFNSGTPAAQASPRHIAQLASAQIGDAISTHADIAFVIDNVNEIKTYDPTGGRFLAAEMFVSQAQPGSRIGVVRITSSDKPTPTLLLNLTTIQSSKDRYTVEQALTQGYFGSIDPGPTAYFVPALQSASQMLLAAKDNNRKYIIVMTDAVALSGDPGPCSASPDPYHQWFCQIPALQSDKITIIFFSFTTPGGQTALRSTQQYLQRYGGMLFQVG